MTVEILRDTVADSKELFKGKVYELTDSSAFLLIAMKKARKIEGKQNLSLDVVLEEKTKAELVLLCEEQEIDTANKNKKELLEALESAR
jgi:hypothetical protein